MKKTIQTIAVAALCLFLTARVYAQTTLTLGDKIPDIEVPGVLNYKSDKLNLTSFKGTPLILDFWATWCATCLYSIPKTDSLQKAFGNKLLFLPVTYQSEKEVLTYLERLQKLKPHISATKHLQIVGDQILHKMFPHAAVPHYVWITADGTIAAITGFRDITADNISKFLNSGRIDAALKKEEPLVRYDKVKPLLSNITELDQSPVTYYSTFSGYLPGLKGGMDIIPATTEKGRKVVIRNVPLTWHYRTAFGAGKTWFSDASIELEVEDKTKFDFPGKGGFNTWINQNGYCYELQLPRHMDSLMYQLMQDDLKRLVPQYSAFTELRKKKVLALVRTSSEDKMATKGGKPSYQFGGLGASMQNIGLNMLISQLSVLFLQNSPLPIVNDTGYSGKVDMVLNAELSDLKALNRALEAYDLQLTEKEKEVAVLVIRDAN